VENGEWSDRDVETRFRRLERQNRALRWSLPACLILAVAPLWVGQPVTAEQPRELRRVEAEEFVLRDADGGVRGKMTVTADGPQLAFFDQDRPTVALIQTRKGPAIRFFGPNGDGSPLFLSVFDGRPRLTMCDGQQTTRASLAIENNGPVLALFGPSAPGDGRGQDAAALLVSDGQDPVIELVSDAGKVWKGQP
jgi:hypothetical protein